MSLHNVLILVVCFAALAPVVSGQTTHRFKPTVGHSTFAARPPVFTVKPGDTLESESLWGEWYERAGGKWPGEVGPIAIEVRKNTFRRNHNAGRLNKTTWSGRADCS